MSTNTSLLPKEVTALVHHVELHRAGWWEKAIHRLVLAAVWLSDHAPNADEIQTTLKNAFKLTLGAPKLSSALSALESQNMLVRLPGNTYRIPDKQRSFFEQEIAEAEKVAADAQSFFCKLVTESCGGLDAHTVWSAFESEFLAPLIKQIGANAYRLIAGERMTADKKLVDRFLSRFEPTVHSKLAEVVTTFLDPKRDEVRAHVSRMLHAVFCVEASGLPENVIQKLAAAVGKQTRFRVFVDTNFLFSILALHENPSNAAASELQELISTLKNNPKVDLFITPHTIEEAKSSISLAKFQLSGLPTGQNFTHAAIRVGFSGMAERFLTERQRRGGKLTAEDYFDPYLNDFVPIARGKGVELFNAKLDSYSTRQDVVDDIHLVLKSEARRLNRRKSYEMVEHDMILWHLVNDHRPAYIESPIDATDWILTVDFRLIGFDEHKQKRSGSKVPLCLHPTSLIQLLQFWVPRTKEFEEAILGSLRLPFLFQHFDAEAERTSLKILKGLGRFEGGDQIPEEAIAQVMLNDGLRARLKSEHSQEEETALIRDALVEEMKARADAEASRARQLHDTVKDREAALTALAAEKRAKDEEIESLRAKMSDEESRSIAASERLATQGAEIDALKTKWETTEERRRQLFALMSYLGMLTIVALFSGLAAWHVDRLFPWYAGVLGPVGAKVLGAVVVFLFGHLLLEWLAQTKPRMMRLWPFRQLKRFRRFLWTLVILSFAVGVFGNLYANRIQKNLDEEKANVPPTPVSSPFPEGRPR